MNGNELYHHGILGQKWGVRRFQNKNGTLTSAGRQRYDDTPADKKRKKMDKETKRAIAGLAVAGTAIVASTVVSNLIMDKAFKQGQLKSRGLVAEFSTKKSSDIRQTAQKGMAYVNKVMSKRQSAMSNTSKAFDALNSVARKFR